jgi:tripartite-type tricarboxylate transporter receptor subunit TctC
MKKLSFFIALVTALGLSNPRGAKAGDYPEKVVQIIEDSAAGSTPDVALRFVAEELSKLWGQQVLVVNHPGAGGSLAARVASAAAPDGYTLYQPVSSTFVALHPAASNVPLKVPRDFLPIGFVSENPMFIATSPSLGIKTLPELLALAKKRPGEISYATTGVGRLTHLTGELLQHEAHIKLQLVPYVGGPAHAISDVATGRVGINATRRCSNIEGLRPSSLMPKQIKTRSGESITSAVPARSKSRARFATICLAVNGAPSRLLVDFAPKNLLMTQGAYVMKGSGS